MEVRGESVVLRPVAGEDVPRLVEIGGQPEVKRWWPNVTAESVSGPTKLAVVFEDEVVGMIQYAEEDDPEYRRASIDIFLSSHVHGRGLGTDAVRSLARWLVRERGHHRVTIDPSTENPAAVRAYEKAGFKPVGVMRQYWTDPSGVRHDGLLMDLLAGEILDA